jgi:hypothetical protein
LSIQQEEKADLQRDVERLRSNNKALVKENKRLSHKNDELWFDNRALVRDQQDLLSSGRIFSSRDDALDASTEEKSNSTRTYTKEQDKNGAAGQGSVPWLGIDTCSTKCCCETKERMREQAFEYLGEIQSLTDVACASKLFEGGVKRRVARLAHIIIKEEQLEQEVRRLLLELHMLEVKNKSAAISTETAKDLHRGSSESGRFDRRNIFIRLSNNNLGFGGNENSGASGPGVFPQRRLSLSIGAAFRGLNASMRRPSA